MSKVFRTWVAVLGVAAVLSLVGAAVAMQSSARTTAQKIDEISGKSSELNTKRYSLADDPRFAISRQTAPTARP